MPINLSRLSKLFLIVSAAGLCACTSTTTVKPYTPALNGGYDESGIEQAVNEGIAGKSAEELTTAGFGYLSTGNVALARLHFTAAISRDAQAALPYVGLGDINYRTHNYPEALANYQKAGTLDPKNLSSLLGQASVLRQQGELNAANEQLGKALELVPGDVRVLNELAINYEDQGQGDMAAPIFKDIVARAPEQASAYNNLGVNQMIRGEYDEAIASFVRAQRLNVTDVQITNNLATALALAGKEEEALALFRKTVGDAAAWNNIGYLYMTRKRLDDAERALHKAQELNPAFYPKAQENLERLERLRAGSAAVASGK